MNSFSNKDIGIAVGCEEWTIDLKELSEADKNSIFYRGIENIQEALNAIRRDNHDFRVVIFIDDLDRCSPSKTLEILESMKIFLSLDGIIYILGLSHTVVTKLIDVKYKETDVKGEEYIKKIIQIPITLPEWGSSDISVLIRDFSAKKLVHEQYKDIIDIDLISNLISKSVEYNPRAVKRFLSISEMKIVGTRSDSLYKTQNLFF